MEFAPVDLEMVTSDRPNGNGIVSETGAPSNIGLREGAYPPPKVSKAVIATLMSMTLAVTLYLTSRPIPHPNVTGGRLLLHNSDGSISSEFTLAGLRDESGQTYVTTERRDYTVGDQSMTIIYVSGEEVTCPKSRDYFRRKN